MPLITNEEFGDIMPHRIEISSPGGYDDEGVPMPGANKRIYMCLLDDEVTEIRNADGTTISISLTAYLSPVPFDAENQELTVPISEKESAKVLLPYEAVKNIHTVERHYDPESQTDLAYMVLRLT